MASPASQVSVTPRPAGLRRRRSGGGERRRISLAALATVVFGAVLSLVLPGAPRVAAATPPPVMTGYVPLNATEFYDGMRSIAVEATNNQFGQNLTFTVGVTNAGDGAIITYDHWEDGYEADPTNPVQASTLIFGDGDPSNGDASLYCSACAGDLLPPGASLIMANQIPRNRSNPAGNPLFDGGDKVLSTRGFTLIGGGYPSTLGSVIAAVLSSYDTTLYNTSYTVPVGPDSPNANNESPFGYTAVLVQASEDGTVVEVDTNADGTFDHTETIDEGQTALVRTYNAGARVRTSAPVQVHLATGDMTETYESRWLTLFADADLASDYMSPAGGPSTSPTYNFLYNPNPNPITVTTTVPGSANVTIPARSSVYVTSPNNSAARFYTADGSPFIAVAAIGALHNSNSSTWDWGTTLVPSERLTSQVVLGWAPGNSAVPPSSGSQSQHPQRHRYNPVFVSANANTTIYVDYDGDPSTGAIAAPSGHCMGARYDQAIPANALQSYTFANPATYTMTGARIYTCDGTKIAAAWGQDPSIASTGAPGFDAGYTVIPTTTLLVDKHAVMAVDTNGDGRFGPGDEVTYQIAIANAGNVPFAEIQIEDVLQSGVTYKEGSSRLDDGTNVTPIPDDTTGTPFPFDEGGRSVSQITAGQRVIVSFEVVVDNPFPTSNDILANTVCVDGVQDDALETAVLGCATSGEQMPLSDLELTKVLATDQIDAPTHIGDVADFLVTITNQGPDQATDVVVADYLGDDLGFVSAVPSKGTFDEGTHRWNVGTLANGETATMRIRATVDHLTATNFAEVVESGSVDPDSQPAEDPLDEDNPPNQDDEDSVTVQVSPAADLELVKRVITPPGGDGKVIFAVDVTNNGPSVANNIEVQERPQNAVSWTGTAPAGTTLTGDTWTIPTLAVGDTVTLDVEATFTSFPATNTAEIIDVDEDDPDSTPGNDDPTEDDQDTVTVDREEADLSLTKTAATSDVNLGGEATFTIAVTNDGPDDATGVVVTDQLPTGLSYVSDDSASAYDPTTGEWVIGDLSNGDTVELTITVSVDAVGTLANMAQVTDSDQYDPDSTPNNHDPADPEDDEDTATVTSTGGTIGDRVWSDIDGDGVQDPGESGIDGITVQLYRTVNGVETLYDTTVTDDGDYSFDDLPPGDYRVVVGTPAGHLATTPVDHTVTLTPGQTYLDADSGFRVAADLSLTKTVLSTPTHVGDEVIFGLTVTNDGPSDATGVVVTDQLPAGLTYVSDDSGGAYDDATGAWIIGNLANGDSATIEITATVTTTGTITNSAEITDSDQWDPDSTPDNDDPDEDDQDSADVDVDALIDLELTKAIGGTAPTYVGDSVVFVLTVTNDGPSDATGVVVTDQLPAGLTYVSDDGNGDYDDATGVWTVGDLANGASASLEITATVDAAGPITNTAEVTDADQEDADSTPDNGDPSEDDQDSVDVDVDELADLSLTKTVVGDAPSYIGDSVTFGITVTNDGPSDATGVVVTDQLPTGLTYVSDDSGGSYDPATGLWLIGTLANGDSVTLEITATIWSTDVTNVAEIASSDPDDPDSTPGNYDPDEPREDDEDEVPLIVEELSDLSLTKSVVGDAPTHIGDSVTFGITVTNDGPSDATGVVVTDQLPTGLTYVSDDGNGAYDPATGIWTVGDIANGDSVTLEITATITDNAVTNVAEITDVDQPDPDSTPGNYDPDEPREDDEDEVPLLVADLADLSLVKSIVGDAPTHIGDSVTFGITVTNDGPSDATGVVVTDQLPTGLTYVSDDGNGDYDSATGVWTIGDLANGDSVTLEITATIWSTDVTNVAEITDVDQDDPDSTPGNYDPDEPREDDEDEVPVTVRELADLSLNKTVVGDAPTHIGDEITYAVTVTNDGPSDATGVVVTDELPTGLTWVSDDGNGAYDPATGEWTIGDLANGGSVTLEITATIWETQVTNTAEITESDQDDPDSTPDNDDPTEDDQSSVPTVVEELSDLSLTKSVVGDAPTHIGDSVTFGITVTNDGPSDATGVVVTDQLPTGLTYVSDDGNGAYDDATGIWTVGDIANGDSVTLEITATITDNAVINVAEITESDQPDPDSTPGNYDPDEPREDDEDEVPLLVADLADLSLVKSIVGDAPSYIGDTVTFGLTVTNDGPSDATGVAVTDQLPAGLTYVSDDGNGDYDSATGVWTIGDLANGDSVTLEITATVWSTDVTNVAEITGGDQDDPDSTPGNDEPDEDDQDEVPVTVDELIDLALTKRVTGTPPTHVGQNATFEISVRNSGPSAATGVVVTDELPTGLTWISDDSGGAYDPATGVWTIGAIDVDETVTLEITVRVDAAGTHTNVAEVTSADQHDIDSTPGNDDPTEDDQDSADVPARELADLSLTKDVVGDAPTHIGDTVTFGITVTNDGPSDATGVVVTDELPAGLTWVSDDSGGDYDPDTGIWTIGDLANGDSVTLEITATIWDNAVTNVAEITSSDQDDPDSTPGNDDPTEDDQDDVPLLVADLSDLSLTKTVVGDAPSYIGDTVTFGLTVTNDGPSDATGVVVTDQLPTGLTYVSDDGNGAYDPATGIWTVGTVADGDSVTLEITATIWSTEVTNVAEITSSDPDDPDSTPGNYDPDEPREDDEDEVPLIVEELSDLSLTKTVVGDAPTHIGDEVTFGITVTNAGPSAATGVVVTDQLPAGLTWVSDDGAGAYDPATGIWTVGTIADGGSVTLEITATIWSNQVTNIAEVTDVDQPDPDSTPGNYDPDEPREDDEDEVPLDVADLADLSLVKTVVGDAPTHIGDTVTFGITVTNDGPSDATGVVVTDELPTGLTYVSDDGNGDYDPATGIWTIGDIANGDTVTLEITATIWSNAVTNVAEITESDQDDPDSTPGNYDPDEPREDDEDEVPLLVADLIDLSLAKELTNAPAYTGDEAIFRISVHNDGPSDATGVVVTDQLPAGLTWVSDDGAGAYDPATGIWTVGALANGATATIEITVSIDTHGEHTNTAEVTAADQDDSDSTPDNGDPDEDDQDDATFEVDALADLALTKTVTNQPVQVGDEIHYLITVTNSGPSEATGVTVTDELPAGLTWLSDDSGGAYDPASGLWLIGSIEPDASASLAIVARIDETTVTNSAEVTSSDQDDPDSTPNNDDPEEDDQDSTTTEVEPVIDLVLSKDIVDAPTYLGDDVTFEITVTNNGPSPATGVVVADQLPAGLTWVSDDSAGAYDPDTGRWDVGNIDADGTRTLRITATVGALAVTNYAEVIEATERDLTSTPGENPLGPDSPPDEDDEDLALVEVDPLIDLELSKTSQPQTVHQLDEAVFVITVDNQGPSPATGVVVEDQLPAGVTWLSDDSAGDYDPATGRWTIGTIEVGATATLEITVHVDEAGDITNRAQVLEANEDDIDSTPGNGFDPNLPVEDDEDSTVLSSEPRIDLALDKAVSADTAHVGSQVTYTLTIDNDGPSPATGVAVTDRLPDGLGYVSHIVGKGTYDPATGIWTIGDLAIGEEAELTVVAEVTAPGPLTNRAQVSAADQRDVDSTPNNADPSRPAEDDEDHATVVGVQIDLELTNTVDRDRVNVGDDVTYRVELTNEGYSTGTGVIVSAPLPPELTYVDASGRGTYDPDTGLWHVGTIEPGETIVLEIVAIVNTGGPITATAEVETANEPDIDSTPGNGVPDEDDIDTVSLTGLEADLWVRKSVDRTTVVIGENVVYTLEVGNHGPTEATGVVVADRLPVGLEFVSMTGDGTYDPATGRWSIDDAIEPGDQRTAQITAKVVSADPITNTIEVIESDQPDPNSTPDNDDPEEDDQDVADIEVISSSLGGTVWLDSDRDGERDSGDPAIPGVTVNLHDSNGDLIATTVTGPDGGYRFEGLPPGTYRVTIDRTTLPSTVDGQTVDPDDVMDGATEVTLGAGEDVDGLDFAYAPPEEPTPPPAGPQPEPEPSDPPRRSGPLSLTGSDVTSPVGIGSILLLAGLAIFTLGRRRRLA